MTPGTFRRRPETFRNGECQGVALLYLLQTEAVIPCMYERQSLSLFLLSTHITFLATFSARGCLDLRLRRQCLRPIPPIFQMDPPHPGLDTADQVKMSSAGQAHNACRRRCRTSGGSALRLPAIGLRTRDVSQTGSPFSIC